MSGAVYTSAVTADEVDDYRRWLAKYGQLTADDEKRLKREYEAGVTAEKIMTEFGKDCIPNEEIIQNAINGDELLTSHKAEIIDDLPGTGKALSVLKTAGEKDCYAPDSY